MVNKYRPRVKICGITSVEDAVFAASAGADAIGLVFYEPSPRYVSPEKAIDIARAVGPFTTVVGLFVDAAPDDVREVLERVPLQLLQFHGHESEDYCQQFRRPYLKALRMKEGLDVTSTISEYESAVGILLDTYRPGVPGGTGEVFDWERVPDSSAKPIVLAGGLTSDNVASAVRQTRPYGVDVSGGVEASAGIKDNDQVLAFISQAKAGVS